MNVMIADHRAVQDRPPLLAPVPIGELLKLAAEFSEQGRLSDAGRLLDYVLGAASDTPLALYLRGIVLFRAGHPDAAAGLIERAIELAPDALLFRRNLCPVYERLGRYEDALRVGHQALILDRYDVQTLFNLALVYHRLLRLDESMACARQALALDSTAPGPHFQLAESHLLRGEFADGWREYEWRYQIPGATAPVPPNKRPPWTGTPCQGGPLLLVADQGYGDVIQFSRYIPWAHTICPDIVVLADPLMHPLIRQVDPRVTVVDSWANCPAIEAYCPLSGLPRLHGTTLDNIPRNTPYLHPEPSRTVSWKARLQDLLAPGYRRIGIGWAGRPAHNNDFNRSTTLSLFGPIAAINRIALISFQKGPAQSEVADYSHRAPLLNLGPEIADFVDTMAIIEQLDLVVTVDTSLAHLAAAMGKPVWILLAYAPDWRWLLGRDTSPWYPTARLFRQTRPGDWAGVMQQVSEALYLDGRCDRSPACAC